MNRKWVVAGVITVAFLLFLTSVHVVILSNDFAVIPKDHFSFADTFVSLETVIRQYNERSPSEKLRGEGINAYLIRKLKEKELIQLTTTSLESSPPAPLIPSPSQQSPTTVRPASDWERKSQIYVKGGQRIFLGLSEEGVRKRLQAAGVSTPLRSEEMPNPKLPDSPIRIEYYDVDGLTFTLVFERPAPGQPYWVVEIKR